MRKPQNQPSLASLTVAEREQLADWLRHGHYNDVLDRATKPRPEGLGLTFTSDKPLRTFYAKVALFDVINAQLSADKKLSLATFESLGQRHIHLFLAASGDEEKLAAAHQAILNTTIELAGTATSATQLLALQRLADFPERAALRAQSAEDLSRLREQSAAIRAERLEIARSKENRAKEMHTHKIALDLRKQSHKEKTAAFKRDLALTRLSTLARNPNPNLNLFSEDPQNFEAMNSTDASSSFQHHGRGAFHPCPTSTSRDALTNNDAASAQPYPHSVQSEISNHKSDHNLRSERLVKGNTLVAGLGNQMNSAPSPLKSFLSPEVIANTNLYDQKIDCGEIRVIYAPGKHYEIEYCNPADEPALTRLHKSGPLRFVEDPTRTHFLPPLRTFGKNPYIPPTTGELNTARPNTDLLITDHSPSAPSSSEPSSENQPAAPSAPIGPIGPISETTNPPAQSEATNPPAASANPAPAPLTRDQRLAEFYKGMAAQARETLQMLNARRARLEQEAQNENHEPQNTEH